MIGAVGFSKRLTHVRSVDRTRRREHQMSDVRMAASFDAVETVRSVLSILEQQLVVEGATAASGSVVPGGLETRGSWEPPVLDVFTDTLATRVVRARHGDSSGVRGAAWLWSVEEANRLP